MKTCANCHKELPLTAFCKCSCAKDGLAYSCKECARIKSIIYRHTPEYKKRVSLYRKTPKYKAYVKMLHQKANYKASMKKYFESPKGRAWTKMWRHTDKGKAATARSGANWRVRLDAAYSTLTGEEWAAIKKQFKNRCVYCGEVKPLTMDHIIPLSKGGQHTKNNIIPACLSCNSAKRDRPVLLQLLVV
jgi:hypothetical protein